MMRKKLIIVLSLFGLSCMGNVAGLNSFKGKAEIPGFEENRGQITDDQNQAAPYIYFKIAQNNFDLYLTEKGVSYVFYRFEKNDNQPAATDPHQAGMPGIRQSQGQLYYHKVNVELEGAVIRKENIVAEGASKAVYDFYYSSCPNGIRGVKRYSRITVKNIYPGIDWVWHVTDTGKIEYDFVVNKGADPAMIKMKYDNADLSVNKAQNELSVETPFCTLREGKAVSFSNGNTVATKYQVSASSVSFKTASSALPLVIDPPMTLYWGTFLNSSIDSNATAMQVFGVSSDSKNNILTCGWILKANGFPLQNNGTYYMGTYPSKAVAMCGISKFTADGELLWSTLYGGTGGFSPLQAAYDITADKADNIYVTGYTCATDTTNNGFAFPLQDEGTFFDNKPRGGYASFILKFDNTGNRLWATLFSGNTVAPAVSYYPMGYGEKLITDKNGNLFIGGVTNCPDIPSVTPAGAYSQTTISGQWADYFAKFDNAGNLLWSTLYEGTTTSGPDQGAVLSADVDPFGNVYFCGETYSKDFPLLSPGGSGYFHNTISSYVTSNQLSPWLMKFDNNGVRKWATFVGGSALEDAAASASLACDNTGNVFFCAGTWSSDVFNAVPAGGNYNYTHPGFSMVGYIIKFDTDANILWSTYTNNNIYVLHKIAVDKTCNTMYALGIVRTPSGLSVNVNGCNDIYPYNSVAGVDADAVLKFDANNNLLWQTILPSGLYPGNIPESYTDAFHIDGGGNLLFSIRNSGNDTASALLRKPLPASYYDPFPLIRSNGGPGSFLCKFRKDTLTTMQVTINNPATCSGTGSASINAVPCSDPPLTYLWSNSQTTSSVSGLTPGSYTVTVTDASCATISSVVKINSGSGSLSVTPFTANAGCGSGKGIAAIAATGGSANYTYSWSNGISTITSSLSDTLKNLNSNTYTVTITEAGGCSVTTTIAVANMSSGATVTSINTINEKCNADKNGSVTINISGGSVPYTYSWSNGTSSVTAASANSIASLSAIPYSVTITDAGGCTTVSTVTITEPSAVSITSINLTNSSCGSGNGSATAAANGGTGALTYNWSNSESGTKDSLLSASTYTLTVTDANSCSTSQSITINNNGGPSISSITSVDEKCKGDKNGTATVNISGGGSPYTYSWSTGSSSITANTQATINNLQSDVYTVTIIDAANCKVISTVAITDPPAVLVSAPLVNTATCGNSNGSASISATGGTGTLNYSWSNFVNGPTNTGLSSGTYIVSVTDANGCSATQTALISNSPAPVITALTSTSVLCNGGNSGSAVVAATGTGTLTYSWSNSQSGNTATALSAATYIITVTDANGCQAISSVVITQPSLLTISNISTTSSSCNKNDGTATASITGGTANYTYSWSNGASVVSSNSSAADNGLGAGTYAITITDNNGCSLNNPFVINSTNGPTATTSITGIIKCNGQTGSIAALTSGGTGPYTYSWSSGASTFTSSLNNSVTSLVANTYTVTVTDNNGCTNTSDITLTQPALLAVTATGTPSSCGGINGIATAVAGGGVFSYTYSWSNDSIAMSNLKSQITNLPPGTYSVTITDGNGCTESSTTIVTNNPGPVASVAGSETNITEGNSTTLIAGGGTSYSWTPSASLNCGDCAIVNADPVTTTTYTVYVKDNNNCVDSAEVTITVKKACGSENDLFIANVFSPNGDGQNDILNIEGNGLANIYWSIYDRWGNLVFETSDKSQGWDGTKNGSSLETGTYVYYLKAICTKNNSDVFVKGNVSMLK